MTTRSTEKSGRIAACFLHVLVAAVAALMLVLSVFLAVVSLEVWLVGTPLPVFIDIPLTAAALLLLVSALLYFQVRPTKTWKTFFVTASTGALYIVVACATGYKEYLEDNLASTEDYKRSVLAIAAAHDYAPPRINPGKSWIYWYWNSVKSPYGGGSPIAAIGGPNEQCVILRSKGIWPFRLQVYASDSEDTIKHPASWLQGTLAHELAHCFDMNRSVPGQYEAWTSLPPYLKQEDERSIAGALGSRRTDTVLWKEAVADLQQIGYWRLTETHDRAQFLSDELARSRDAMARGSNQDNEHATTCWINFARSRAGPSGMGELFEWASALRMAAYRDRHAACAGLLDFGRTPAAKVRP